MIALRDILRSGVDHILLRPHLVPLLKKAEVDREVRGWGHGSDHASVWVEVGE